MEVTTRGGRTSVSNSLFSYAAPAVASISPSVVLTGSVKYNISVTGSNLGMMQSHLEWISVGQQRCSRVVFVSSEEVICQDVEAPWYDANVVVQV